MSKQQQTQTRQQQSLPNQPATQPQGASEPNGNGNTGPVPSGKQIAGKAKTLGDFLNANKATLEEFAKGFMKPEAMIRLAQMAFVKNPTLAKCTLGSILRALMDSAALRVKPGGVNGRGYLVPRKNNNAGGVYEAHFDPGWRGLVDVARRSGLIKSIGAQVVRSGDVFEYGYNPLPVLTWKPARDGEVNRPIVAAFAVAELKDGGIQIEVLEGEDLEKIKGVSEAAKRETGPWMDWPTEMARKSVVKRLCKYLPVPDDFDDLDRAMTISDAADTGQRGVIDVPGETIPDDGFVSQSDEIRGALEAGERGPSLTDQLDALAEETEELSVGG